MLNDLGRGQSESRDEDPLGSAEGRQFQQGNTGISAGTVTLIGALIALLSAGVTSLIGGYWQFEAEDRKAEAQLDIQRAQEQFQILLRATEGVKPEVAAKNLQFFIDIGYLTDPTGKIKEYAERGEAPTIPGVALPYGPETCKQGFVWREASPTDLVCVPPDVRERVRSENAKAADNRVPDSLAPDTCKQELVWREAFPGDTVCVTPARRDATKRENELASSRKVISN
jgi:hypothetical protein